MNRLVLVLAISGIAAACDGSPINSQQGYQPEQPIAYSHALHAGLYELDCQYCHSGAERSRHAGVPSTSVCMNCHSHIRTESPEIKRLAQFVATDTPVPWVRVHRLPDFAFFSHASHVSAGLACQGCHGPVEQMVRVEQTASMSMGWCLDCHRDTRQRQPQAPLPLATLAVDKLATPEAIPARKLSPPTDCSGCHR